MCPFDSWFREKNSIVTDNSHRNAMNTSKAYNPQRKNNKKVKKTEIFGEIMSLHQILFSREKNETGHIGRRWGQWPQLCKFINWRGNRCMTATTKEVEYKTERYWSRNFAILYRNTFLLSFSYLSFPIENSFLSRLMLSSSRIVIIFESVIILWTFIPGTVFKEKWNKKRGRNTNLRADSLWD